MVTTFVPFAVFLGAAGAAAIFFIAFWERIVRVLTPYTEPQRERLSRTDVKIRAEELTIAIVGSGVALWAVTIVLFQTTLWLGALLLPMFLWFAFFGCRLWIDYKIKKRLATFNVQLEMVLRMMASGLRVGLGLRQAMVLVVNEAGEPSRSEFARVLGQTTLGVPIYDALDQLATRMPSSEMTMMTRSIRIQSQTGGNLARVLETLAETIKQRRRIARKINSMTSEARLSGYVITGLPLLVGTFIIGFEPQMRVSLLTTAVGRFSLLGVAVLMVLGQFTMNKISTVDV